jgi:hypothetical protein
VRVSATRVVVAAMVACPPALSSAQPPLDTLRQIARASGEVEQLGRAYGDSIWPGYRPDTIPLLFALPGRGFVLAGWHRALPAGFLAVDGVPNIAWSDSSHGSSASTAQALSGATVAQVSVSSLDPDYLVPTAFHEAFHVFERASRRPESWFGETENLYYFASYPVFDVTNEAGFALEGRVLAAALAGPTEARRRELAREFVAVRRARLEQLDADHAEFDRASEMNEGLAEYALVRALRLIVTHGPPNWRPAARQRLEARRTALAVLTRDGQSSFRIRYYKTGPAIATLLDDLAPNTWKRVVMTSHETLDGELAVVSGFDAPARAWRDAAAQSFDASTLRAAAADDVAALKTTRLAQVDSLLHRPGFQLLLSGDSLPAKDLAVCGMDPQNLLQVTPASQLHTRWVHLCAGKALDADLDTPTFHEDSTGTFRSVVAPVDSIRITTADGSIGLDALRHRTVCRDVVITDSHLRVASSRALVSVDGDTLRVEPLP